MDRSTLLWQVVIGMWLSMAAYIGIVARSWDTFFSFVYVAAFFAAWGAANALMRSGRKPLRVLGIVGSCAFGLVMFGGMLLGAERVYLMNAQSYPHFMAQNLGTADYHTIERLQAYECKGSVVEVFEKANYNWVIRCGQTWLTGHTYISNADPYRALRNESKEPGQ